jgi:serine/threonine protein kinase
LASDKVHVQVLDVAHGLTYLHRKRVVHGDLKPVSDISSLDEYRFDDIPQDNVLMTADGVAQIIDFGLAQVIGVSGFTTIIQRNSRYTAPELMPATEVENQSMLRSTRQTDVFSFAMFLLEVRLTV